MNDFSKKLRRGTEVTTCLLALALCASFALGLTSCENGTAAPIIITAPATNPATPTTGGGTETPTSSSRTTNYGSKAPSQEKAVGDIIFVDGSAEPYSDDLVLTEEQKQAAIAVVFYEGEASTDQLGAMTIGVGLRECEMSWSKVGTDVFSQNSTATDKNHGFVNMAAVKAYDDYKSDGQNKYPAFYWTANYSDAETRLCGTKYESDWYIPAENEMKELYKQAAIVNKAIAKVGGTPFQTGDTSQYWCSDVDLSDGLCRARFVTFSNGEFNSAGLSTRKYNVRPVSYVGSGKIRTVKFDSANGDEISSQYVGSGKKAARPTIAPTKGSQKFRDWYLNGKEFNFEETPITQDITLTAKYWIGSKTPTEQKQVSDIVFNDGSALHYQDYPRTTLTDEQRATAIAAIFYAGPTIIKDVYMDLGTRVLGVGIKQNREGLAWCASDAAAYGKAIDSISCKPINGHNSTDLFLFSVQGLSYVCEFESPSDSNGSDNLAQIASALGTSNDTNDSSKYPAFYWAKNYKNQEGSRVKGTDFEDGWYLPTLPELQVLVYTRNTLALSDVGGQFVSNNDSFGESAPYWSSSQPRGESSAYIWDAYIDTANGYSEYIKTEKAVDKASTAMVCAIREF